MFRPESVRVLSLLARVNALQAWRRLRSVREQSRLLTAIILLFICGYVTLAFWLFYKGLRFIAAFPGLGTVLTERLLFLLFAILFALLLPERSATQGQLVAMPSYSGERVYANEVRS